MFFTFGRTGVTLACVGKELNDLKFHLKAECFDLVVPDDNNIKVSGSVKNGAVFSQYRKKNKDGSFGPYEDKYILSWHYTRLGHTIANKCGRTACHLTYDLIHNPVVANLALPAQRAKLVWRKLKGEKEPNFPVDVPAAVIAAPEARPSDLPSHLQNLAQARDSLQFAVSRLGGAFQVDGDGKLRILI